MSRAISLLEASQWLEIKLAEQKDLFNAAKILLELKANYKEKSLLKDLSLTLNYQELYNYLPHLQKWIDMNLTLLFVEEYVISMIECQMPPNERLGPHGSNYGGGDAGGISTSCKWGYGVFGVTCQ